VRRAALLLLACCAQRSLLNDVKAVLAERERALSAYSFKAQTNGAAYAVAFRGPRSTLLELPQGAFSFDGARFYERDDAARTMTTYEPEGLNAEKLALAWNQSFGAKIPEGFRAPLLPPRGVEARLAGDTVELTLRTRDEDNDVTVTSVLRWPSGDFLERRTDYGGARGLVRVDDEHCEARLCVPTRLTKWAGDAKLEETALTDVQLRAEVPRDAFALVAPQGFAVTRSTLVPTR